MRKIIIIKHGNMWEKDGVIQYICPECGSIFKSHGVGCEIGVKLKCKVCGCMFDVIFAEGEEG